MFREPLDLLPVSLNVAVDREPFDPSAPGLGARLRVYIHPQEIVILHVA